MSHTSPFFRLYPQTRAVFFDLDGTLAHSLPDVAHALNRTLTAYRLPVVSETQVGEWIGRGAARLIACALDASEDSRVPSEEMLQHFMQLYAEDVSSRTTLFPGVRAFLEFCEMHGLRMACITNKPEAPARQLLADLGIDHYFEVVAGGDTYPLRKPDPYPLLATLSQMGLRATETVMIGDSRNDVEAAHAAGMPCIALRYGYNHGEPVEDCHPDNLLDSLQELL